MNEGGIISLNVFDLVFGVDLFQHTRIHIHLYIVESNWQNRLGCSTVYRRENEPNLADEAGRTAGLTGLPFC